MGKEEKKGKKDKKEKKHKKEKRGKREKKYKKEKKHKKEKRGESASNEGKSEDTSNDENSNNALVNPDVARGISELLGNALLHHSRLLEDLPSMAACLDSNQFVNIGAISNEKLRNTLTELFQILPLGNGYIDPFYVTAKYFTFGLVVTIERSNSLSNLN